MQLKEGFFKFMIFGLILIAQVFVVSCSCWENYSLENFEAVPWPNIGSGWSIDNYNQFYIGNNPNFNSFGFNLEDTAVLYFEWKSDFNRDKWGLFTFIEPGGIEHFCNNSSWDQVKFPVGPGEVKWSVEKAPNDGRGFIKNLCIQHFNKECKKLYKDNNTIPIAQVPETVQNNTVVAEPSSSQNQTKYGPSYIGVNALNYNKTAYIYKNPQEAIDVVQEYGIVEIQEGNYSQYIVVRKPVIIRGINKEKTNISGSLNKDTITVLSPGVTIENLTICGGEYGINIEHSDKSLINNNNIVNSNESGICLLFSNNCNVTNNFINNSSYYGITIVNSNNNFITNNQISTCKSAGINIKSSEGNEFKPNFFLHVDCLFRCFNASSNYYPPNLKDCHDGLYIYKKYINSSCTNG